MQMYSLTLVNYCIFWKLHVNQNHEKWGGGLLLFNSMSKALSSCRWYSRILNYSKCILASGQALRSINQTHSQQLSRHESRQNINNQPRVNGISLLFQGKETAKGTRHHLLVLFDDGSDGEAAGLGGRLTFKHSLCALVTNRRAAGEGNQARILTAGRREYWDVGRDREGEEC